MFKLLAVDVPSASGPTRLYLEGGPDTYERGGVLRELRDPFVNAMALQRAHEAEDDDDDAADAAAAAAAGRARAADAVLAGMAGGGAGKQRARPWWRVWLCCSRCWR